MAQFVIPTIFTAKDAYSGPMGRMTGATSLFNNTLRDAARSAKDLVGAAAAVTAAAFTGKALVDFESEVSNLSAVTGVEGKELDDFKEKIIAVGEATKTSAVSVAQAATAIGNNMPELLKDAAGLTEMTRASIVLSKASRMELGPTAEAMTDIFNQYSIGAKDAAKSIDILAAGSQAGSSELKDTQAALKEVGSTAILAGLDFKQAVGMIELVSKFEKGAEAGTKLRNILLYMSTIKVQDPTARGDMQRLGVDMNVVSNAALPLSQRMKELSKISGDSAALFHLFGKENMAMGVNFLKSYENLDPLLSKMDASGVAASMAAKNMNNLKGAVSELSAKWQNMAISSDTANASLNLARETVQMLERHLEGVVNVTGTVLALFIAYQAPLMYARVEMWALTTATAAYNFVEGIALGLTGDMKAAIVGSRAAFIAYTAWTYAVTAAQWAWNAAAAIGFGWIALIVVGIVALSAVVVAAVRHISGWGDQWGEVTKYMGAKFTVWKDGVVIGFQVLNFAFWEMAHAMVYAWEWTQNKLGAISDKQFAADKERWAAERDERLKGIKDTYAEMQKAQAVAGEGIAWKMHWNSTEQLNAADSANNSSAPAAMQAQTDTAYSYSETNHKSQMELVVTTAPGTQVAVAKNSNRVPVTISNTGGMGQW